PPFKGATALDTLDQVRRQEPVPPSRLQPKLPRDLETVCLKCLRKDPAQRYASALKLAQDLRRFLDGRPILAKPVGRLGRVWKWARREPREAILAAASLIMVVVIVVGSVVWGVREMVLRKAAEDQRQRAEDQWQRAEDQRQRADRAVREF